MKNVIVAITVLASTLPFASAYAQDQPSDQGVTLALRLNAGEFWAEGVQAYFDCMRPQYGANTREKLQKHVELHELKDGEQLGRALWGTAVPVDPGSHVIEAMAPGKKPFRVVVEIPFHWPVIKPVAVPMETASAPSWPVQKFRANSGQFPFGRQVYHRGRNYH
jgi:hypothetical protein